MRRARILTFGLPGLAGLFVVLALAGYLALRASLPVIDGEQVSTKLAHAASIERDAEGTPTIRGKTRRDLAYATGYAHGQDRFFQMDLMRRAASGELAELLGRGVLDVDTKFRVHDFRRVAIRVVADASSTERELLETYTAGVNDALANAGARPWEYLLLRSTPAPWRVEDSVLVAFSMYLNLNDSTGEEEVARQQLRETLPP